MSTRPEKYLNDFLIFFWKNEEFFGSEQKKFGRVVKTAFYVSSETIWGKIKTRRAVAMQFFPSKRRRNDWLNKQKMILK